MKKILVTIVLAISLAGSFIIAQGSESPSQGQAQAASTLNNAPGFAFAQRGRRRWRRWRRHERRERRRERREERRERRGRRRM